MRVKGVKFWIGEASKPKQLNRTIPKNIEEELNYEIALYFIFSRKNKSHRNKKLVA